MLYDSIYIQCPEWAKPQKLTVGEWLPRVGGKGEMD